MELHCLVVDDDNVPAWSLITIRRCRIERALCLMGICHGTGQTEAQNREAALFDGNMSCNRLTYILPVYTNYLENLYCYVHRAGAVLFG